MVGQSGQVYELRNNRAVYPILNDIKEISSTQDTCLALTSKGTLYELTRYDGQFSKVKLSCISLPVVSFACSYSHCIALDKAGVVWVWGPNRKGELGLGDCAERRTPSQMSGLTSKRITSVLASDGFSVALCKVDQQKRKTTKPKEQENFSPQVCSF